MSHDAADFCFCSEVRLAGAQAACAGEEERLRLRLRLSGEARREVGGGGVGSVGGWKLEVGGF